MNYNQTPQTPEEAELIRRLFEPHETITRQGIALPSPELIAEYYQELEQIRFAHAVGELSLKDVLIN